MDELECQFIDRLREEQNSFCVELANIHEHSITELTFTDRRGPTGTARWNVPPPLIPTNASPNHTRWSVPPAIPRTIQRTPSPLFQPCLGRLNQRPTDRPNFQYGWAPALRQLEAYTKLIMVIEHPQCVAQNEKTQIIIS
ncbi:hypothetical protein CBL_04984 [Carabus blaptoides fortunei]